MNDVNLIELVPLAALMLFLLLQTLSPRRPLAKSGRRRGFHNVMLFALNSVLLKVFIPLTLVSVSHWSADHSIGIFNWFVLPNWLATVACLLLLDLSVYGQHVATHHFAVLWRIHKVHHADTDMDVTTAVRFHPLELLLSLAYKSAVVLTLGAPVAVVLGFELLLLLGSGFSHSNIKLSASLDRILRWAIVTPDTHRSHHSIISEEQNTNYGFFLIWWDKAFGTYTDIPIWGHQSMPIGLNRDDDQCDRVDQMLRVPFR
jgi:sterol desaturase/sphingolipid hydroxylase (fatty acid hydroxylase superfamily)